MPHEPRLTRALRDLLRQHRVAALGTLTAEGTPFVSMVPFALLAAQNMAVLHLSLLAPHTRNLLGNPAVSLMVMQAEVAGQPVHALPRVSLEGLAHRLQPQSDTWQAARQTYLTRFAEAEPMFELGDFSLVGVTLQRARQVAGFGSARPLDMDELTELLAGLSGF